MEALLSLWLSTVPWIVLLLLAAIAVLVGMIFDKVVLETLRRLAQRTTTQLDDLVLAAIHPALGLLVTIVAFQVGLSLLALRVPAEIVVWWSRLNLALAILVVAVLVARLVSGLIRYGGRNEPRLLSAARLGARVLNVAVYAVAFLVVLDTYGVSITPLVTSLGIAGLAVALALQDTLSNFFAGVWIQTGQSLQPGHYVRLESERLEGFVVEVGWRTTKIRQLANNIIVVPNSRLAQAIVIDYDLPEPRMGTSVQVAVAPGSDVRRVLEGMAEEARLAAKEFPGILEQPTPTAELKDFTDTGLLVSVGFYVARYTDQGPAQNAVRQRILDRFRRDGIQVAHVLREARLMPADPGTSPASAPFRP